MAGQNWLGEKILTNRRENIDEHNLFVHHRGAVPATGREVKYVSGRSDAFLAFNKEPDAALNNDGHLLV